MFHAGTRRAAPTARYETNGGRVLTVVGRGPSLADARDAAERRARTLISFEGVQRRHDIASGAVPVGVGAMIPRYTLPEMGAIWTDEARFEAMLRVEIAVARAQAGRGLVPADALAAIETRGRPSTSPASPRSSRPPTTTSSRS